VYYIPVGAFEYFVLKQTGEQATVSSAVESPCVTEFIAFVIITLASASQFLPLQNPGSVLLSQFEGDLGVVVRNPQA